MKAPPQKLRPAESAPPQISHHAPADPAPPGVNSRPFDFHEVPWEISHPPLHSEILAARLAGRHGHSRKLVLMLVDPDWFTEEQRAMVFRAFDAGVEARKDGVQCMCAECSMPSRIAENERKRGAYAVRRTAELLREGRSPADVRRLVREEIDLGMAL